MYCGSLLNRHIFQDPIGVCLLYLPRFDQQLATTDMVLAVPRNVGWAKSQRRWFHCSVVINWLFSKRTFFFLCAQIVDGFFTALDSSHLRAEDRDGDVISYVIIQKPSHGRIVKVVADDDNNSSYENIDEFTQDDIDNEIVGYLQTDRQEYMNQTSKPPLIVSIYYLNFGIKSVYDGWNGTGLDG